MHETASDLLAWSGGDRGNLSSVAGCAKRYRGPSGFSSRSIWPSFERSAASPRRIDGNQGLCRRERSLRIRKQKMSNDAVLSLAEIDRRIAIVRDNIRQLIEQAAAFSGAEDEDRNADRLAQQNEELERLVKERDALLKK
jgi:uncharacterized small protein (DUF1192 family)